MVDEVAQEDQWELKTIDDFIGGLNTDKRQNAVADNQLVAVSNLVTQKEQVKVDTGYTTFGQAVRGYPQADIEFKKTTGTSFKLTTADATAAAGTETFGYEII